MFTAGIIVLCLSSFGLLVSRFARRSAVWRHALLLSTLALCALMPLAWMAKQRTNLTLLKIPTNASVSLSAREPPAFVAETESQLTQLPAADLTLPAARAEVLVPQQTSTDSVAETDSTVSPSLGIDTPAAASGGKHSIRYFGYTLYALISLGLMIRLARELLWIHRQRRNLPVPIFEWRGIPAFEVPVAVPMALGFGTPAILLPRGITRALEDRVVQDILEHELQHLRRRDHWVLLFQGIMRAIYWPVPTLHLLNRRLNLAREELCDRAALKDRDPVQYGESLLSVASLASGRWRSIQSLTASIVVPGMLESRIESLLDQRRDSRTEVKPVARVMMVACLVGAAVLVATTRVIPVEPSALAYEPPAEPVLPRHDLTWTETPRVDPLQPTLHRGIVVTHEGTPLAGASVYAIGAMEVLENATPEEINERRLGKVRGVTDERGRFEFEAPDLTWITPAGEQKRRETLLVATKSGVAPAWLKTWGEDRGFRSHWNPHIDREVLLRARPTATLQGQLRLADDTPLVGAKVRLTELMAPIEYDLEKHIEQEEIPSAGLFSSVDYAEQLWRPWILPGMSSIASTDDQGRFAMQGLPEGFIAQLEIRHPTVMTTHLRVAIRERETVYRNEDFPSKEATPRVALYGSGFSAELRPGNTIRGKVVSPSGVGMPGIEVALANHNASSGFDDRPVKTDVHGDFELTGLRGREDGYDLAAVGSFQAPFASKRQHVSPDEPIRIELAPAVRYRLRLIDSRGNPLDREVYSSPVQPSPRQFRRDVKFHFNVAEKIGPGLYAGIVPPGPAVVYVHRLQDDERHVAVDPKAFFAPGRTDWNFQESYYAFGNSKHIAMPGVMTTESLVPNSNPTLEQFDLAAAVLTNARLGEELELTATIHRDPAVSVSLFDEVGDPVTGASVQRELKRYDAKDLPAEFNIHGLHPEVPEFLSFYHAERNLIGTVSMTWSDSAVHVTMRPAATIIGRLVDAKGKPDSTYFVRLAGKGIFPDTIHGARVFQLTNVPGERKGEFRIVVPPLMEVRGDFIRNTRVVSENRGQETLERAFGPLTPEPGQTIDLGDLRPKHLP